LNCTRKTIGNQDAIGLKRGVIPVIAVHCV
jgi:hypothetical protein